MASLHLSRWPPRRPHGRVQLSTASGIANAFDSEMSINITKLRIKHTPFMTTPLLTEGDEYTEKRVETTTTKTQTDKNEPECQVTGRKYEAQRRIRNTNQISRLDG